ncbi:hypothetical protein [Legionella massiliensis]|nr:hypothetical protein [Legionella massiliensis]
MIDPQQVTKLSKEAREKALENAKVMGAEYKPKLPEPHKLIQILYEKVPLLSGFLRGIDGTGASLGKLAILKGDSGIGKPVAGGLVATSDLLLALDLIRLPIIIAAAKYYGVELPFTLTDGAKTIYTLILFGLGVATLLAPAVVLPILGAVSAILAFVASAIAFGKLISDLVQNAKERKVTAKALQQAEEALQAVEELKDLESKVKGLVADLDNPELEGKHAEIAEKLIALRQLYDEKVKPVQDLRDKEFLLKYKWDNELGMGTGVNSAIGLGLGAGAVCGALIALIVPPLAPLGAAIIGCCAAVGTAYFITRLAIASDSKLDKAVGLTVAAGVIASAVVGIFFPPIGLAVFAGCIATGGAYLLGRVAVPAIIKYIKNRKEAKDEATASLVDSEKDGLGPQEQIKQDAKIHESPAPVSPEHQDDDEEIHESTGLVVALMSGKEHAEEALRKLTAFQQWLEKVDNTLHSHIANNSAAGVLEFFNGLAVYAQKQEFTVAEAQGCINNLCETNPEALIFLKSALKDPMIADEQKQGLLIYRPVVEALMNNKVMKKTITSLLDHVQQLGPDDKAQLEQDDSVRGEVCR